MTIVAVLVAGPLVELKLIQFVRWMLFYPFFQPGQQVIVDKMAAGENPTSSRGENQVELCCTKLIQGSFTQT